MDTRKEGNRVSPVTKVNFEVVDPENADLRKLITFLDEELKMAINRLICLDPI